MTGVITHSAKKNKATEKPGIFGILECSQTFHNCIPTNIHIYPDMLMKVGKPCVTLEIHNPDILTTLEYSKL